MANVNYMVGVHLMACWHCMKDLHYMAFEHLMAFVHCMVDVNMAGVYCVACLCALYG